MGTPFRLKLLKVDNSSKTIHITELGVKVLGGGALIYELTATGINCQAGKKELPFIYLRRRAHSDISARQVYLSAGELRTLAEWFSLPEQVANRSFYEMIETNSIRNNHVDVLPLRHELLDPAFRAEFLRWISDPMTVPIPQPQRFPWLATNIMTMPGLVESKPFNNGKRAELPGEMELMKVLDQARAVFHLNGGKDYTYALGPNNFKLLLNSTAPVESFDKVIFQGLFGPSPKVEQYNCARIARKAGVHFANLQGISFGVKGGSHCPFKPGTLYYFRLERFGNKVVIRSFMDEARSLPYNMATIHLVDGYPAPNIMNAFMQPIGRLG